MEWAFSFGMRIHELKHYAKYIPSEDRRYMDAVDHDSEKVGTKTWHQTEEIGKADSEAIENLVGRVGVEPTAR
jgi:hypothetical protein